MSYNFDTVEVVKKMEQEGISRSQAEAFAQIIRAANAELATTKDLKDLEHKIDLRLDNLHAELTGQITASEAKMAGQISEQIAASEAKMVGQIAASEMRMIERIAASEMRMIERIAASDAKISELKERITASEAKTSGQIAASEEKMIERMTSMEVRMNTLAIRLIVAQVAIFGALLTVLPRLL